ncbi:NADP-dependent D-sorbitol-6-phosphate dehydrogenase [Amborella trichopoda]|uniref:NADP-dependent D-sorbitol-6-phosphate dehydrogenase n=1 Tax=Amborella trichopoda TaxID=13333 RepID=UPI0009BFD55C|nr:NADP-dependent D-sorbitol-6-phosphate dehydrogenase [Amborella trichopoda]|eukprot:XP_020529482.1 NADP-dependent D-sorbitol-6-phosphate dehydrogenase [Amborella trichopoda]
MAITLNNGFKMPIIGLGVWRMEKNLIRDLLLNAIKLGYRHFDCAADYGNEAEVGEVLSEALRSGLVKREDLFITTKLWNSDHGHILEACKDSLKKLKLEYLDLYLVHFPIATRHTGVGTTDSALGEDGVLDIDTTISLETTWHAMEDLVSKGLVRSIEFSCLLRQDLSKKYDKSPAQIALRWGIQRNTVVIPKSSRMERLKENFDVLDFELSDEDMDLIKKMDRRYRTNTPAKFWGIDFYA